MSKERTESQCRYVQALKEILWQERLFYIDLNSQFKRRRKKDSSGGADAFDRVDHNPVLTSDGVLPRTRLAERFVRTLCLVAKRGGGPEGGVGAPRTRNTAPGGGRTGKTPPEEGGEGVGGGGVAAPEEGAEEGRGAKSPEGVPKPESSASGAEGTTGPCPKRDSQEDKRLRRLDTCCVCVNSLGEALWAARTSSGT